MPGTTAAAKAPAATNAPASPLATSATAVEEPEKHDVQRAESNDANDGNGEDPITNWQTKLHPNIRRIFEGLRQDIERMEENILRAENEVFKKEEEAFFQRQDENETVEMQRQQVEELQRAEVLYNVSLEERRERKVRKRLLALTQKEAKARETKIRQQETVHRMGEQIKEARTQHRRRFDELVKHVEARHERQREQLIAAQERKLRDQQSLLQIETRGLEETIREEILKDFNFRVGHQNTLNKIAVDQLLEMQQLELNRRKEQFDAEAKAIEANAYLKIQNLQSIYQLAATQKTFYSKEKHNLADARERIKLNCLEAQRTVELKKMKAMHKIALRACVRAQKQRMAIRMQKWRETTGNDMGDNNVTKAHASTEGSTSSLLGTTSSSSFGDVSNNTSSMSLDQASNPYLNEAGVDPSSADDAREKDEVENILQGAMQQEQRQAEQELASIQQQLTTCAQNQRAEMAAMRKQQQASVRELEDANRRELEELFLMQDSEMRSLKKSHESTLIETMAAQQREHQMEASIRAAERRTMTERRTLNTVLDNVMDGIINIDTSGIINRINKAVENMLGYTADELLNKNVKMIVPPPYGEVHDQLIQRYLRTRIPTIIGSARKLHGVKKDGSHVPVHISISEVREEEFHIFTGVLRDLTETVKAEEAAAREEVRKNQEMQQFMADLEAARARSKRVIESIIPVSIADRLLQNIPVPPKSYEECTILFTDICGFTELSSSSDPLDIVDLLNDIYSCFDEIIDQYDVFKVETIGDSYMVASGVPNPNGSRHLSEIAMLALHLVKAVQTIKIRHKPSAVLRMRVGIHTGPVVAGVVGRKMPRYCLFGDTVAIASRMESAGLPMKIQVSEATFEKLEKISGFHFEARGEMNIPGRPSFKTYFLESKDNFDPVVNLISMEKNPLMQFLRRGEDDDNGSGKEDGNSSCDSSQNNVALKRAQLQSGSIMNMLGSKPLLSDTGSARNSIDQLPGAASSRHTPSNLHL